MARRGTQSSASANESEDSYFISMTDLLVGLIFIFIILIVFFAILVAQENKKIKEQQIDAERLQILLLQIGDLQGKLNDANARLEGLEQDAIQRESTRAGLVQGSFPIS